MNFNGTNQAINLVAGGALNCINGQPGATICHWHTPAVANSESLFSLSINNGGTPTDASRFYTFLSSTAPIGRAAVAGRAGDTDTSRECNGASVLTNGVQYFIGGVCNVAGDVQKVIQDEAVVSTCTPPFAGATFSNTDSTSASLMAQDRAVSNWTPGSLEDARIYQRALNDAEMQTIAACRGHDGIWFGIHHRWSLATEPPGTAAVTGRSIVDLSNQSFPAAPVGTPTYEETRLSYRRRYR